MSVWPIKRGGGNAVARPRPGARDHPSARLSSHTISAATLIRSPRLRESVTGGYRRTSNLVSLMNRSGASPLKRCAPSRPQFRRTSQAIHRRELRPLLTGSRNDALKLRLIRSVGRAESGSGCNVSASGDYASAFRMADRKWSRASPVVTLGPHVSAARPLATSDRSQASARAPAR